MTQPGLVGVSPGMEDGTKDGIKMAAAQEVGEQEETRDKIYHGQKRFLVADQYVFIDLLFFHHQKKQRYFAGFYIVFPFIAPPKTGIKLVQ